jgi:hypothetical protein
MVNKFSAQRLGVSTTWEHTLGTSNKVRAGGTLKQIWWLEIFFITKSLVAWFHGEMCTMNSEREACFPAIVGTGAAFAL